MKWLPITILPAALLTALTAGRAELAGERGLSFEGERIVSSLEPGAAFSPDWAEPVAPPEDSASPSAVRQTFGPIVPAARQPAGALSGRIVFMNGGHGWTYDPNYWRLLRGNLQEMNEDYGNIDQLNFFATYCFNAGAVVVPFRPLGQQTNEVVLDQDDPAVTWTGSWADSASTIFFGDAGDVPYRYAALAATETATATYVPAIPVAGYYPVYTWVRHGSDRGDQLYRIRHTGGESQVRLPHHLVGNGWIYLGEYFFNAGASAANGAVVISNLRGSTNGGVVIADAIRFGNGLGSVDRGGGVSTYPREDESCRYWIQASLGQEQSSSLYDGSGDDESDGWSAPPKMSAEMNREAAGSMYQRIHISFHSNAGGGRGSIGLITSDPTPNQATLAYLCGREVNDDLVALGSPPLELPWHNRSTFTYSGGYSEITGSLFNYEMDATIIEVAFHDSADDARLLRDSKARAAVGKAAMHAVVKYMNQFDSGPLEFLPEPPTNLRAAGAANRTIRLDWDAPVSTGGSSAPTGYVIYRSTNGYGFGNPITVGNVLAYRLAGLPAGVDYYFRVAAVNAGGESLPSAVVGCAMPMVAPAPRVLVVNAFDRFDRTTNLRQDTTRRGWAPPDATGVIERVWPRRVNAFDYVVSHGQAISAFGLPFDSCQSASVADGEVALGDYRIVVWACGQESTADETFSSAEQAKIAEFRHAGGHLLVSGSEIAWDLDRATGPTAADRAFFNQHLRADLASDANDNSQSYAVEPAGGGIFAARSGTIFDDGSRGLYWVRSPDVLTPFGAGVTAALAYAGNANGAAAIQYDGSAGGGKVVYFGFPLETITSASRRNEYVADTLAFFTADVITLVGVGSLWKYRDTGTDLGAAWRAPDYRDVSWPSGPAQLGFGDGDEATVVNTNRARITTYFRRTFMVANPAVFESVNLRLKRDDSAVVYLNGSELFRSNLPTNSPIGWSTQALTAVGGANESAWFSYSFSPEQLRPGTNLLAVELHQSGTNSSDLSFDLELVAVPRPATPVTFVSAGAVWRYHDNAVDLGTAWRGTNFSDLAWKSGPALLGFGDANGVLPATPVASNGQWTTYFRHRFYVPDPALVMSLSAQMQRDDGVVVYLNGTEVWRDNLPLPPTNIVFSTPATTAISGAGETTWLAQPLNPSLLQIGWNLLAVEVHQNQLSSSDLSFDFKLSGTAILLESPALTAAPSVNGFVLSWPASAGGFSLLTATNLAPPVWWTPVPESATLVGDRWVLPLGIANERSRFYRLQLR